MLLLLTLGCAKKQPALTKDQLSEAKAVQMLQEAAPQLTVARASMSKGGTPPPLHVGVPVAATRCYRVAAHPEREPMMSAVAINGCKVRSLALFADGNIRATNEAKIPTTMDPVVKR